MEERASTFDWDGACEYTSRRPDEALSIGYYLLTKAAQETAHGFNYYFVLSKEDRTPTTNTDLECRPFQNPAYQAAQRGGNRIDIQLEEGRAPEYYRTILRQISSALTEHSDENLDEYARCAFVDIIQNTVFRCFFIGTGPGGLRRMFCKSLAITFPVFRNEVDEADLQPS